MGPTSNSNQFFGVKVSQVGTPVNQAADSQLVYKSNFSTNLFNGPSGIWKVMEGTRVPTIGNGLLEPQQGFWVAIDGVDVQQAIDSQMVFSSSNPIVNTANLFNPYQFSVYRNAGWANSGLGLLVCDTKLYDTGDNYSTSTGNFTAPINGFWNFSVAMSLNTAPSVGYGVAIAVNGNIAKDFISETGGSVSFAYYATVSGDVELSAGDTVEMWAYTSGNAGDTGTSTFFDGHMISGALTA